MTRITVDTSNFHHAVFLPVAALNSVRSSSPRTRVKLTIGQNSRSALDWHNRPVLHSAIWDYFLYKTVAYITNILA